MDASEGRDYQSIGAISYIFGSYLRYRCAALASSQQNHTSTESTIELDSHEDFPVVGLNARITETTSKTVLVSGFTSDLGNHFVSLWSTPLWPTAASLQGKLTSW